jgi:riboflavin synthase
MFTGLIADVGRVERREDADGGVRLLVATRLAGELSPGDSISLSGVCLTAAEVEDGRFTAEAMNETLVRSSLAGLQVGSMVNLELAVRAGDRLGGHLVQGHVDGLGTVSSVAPDGFARVLTVEVPEVLLRYVVEKGSITVDGVSLTVVETDSRSFTVSLIPETLERTTLGALEPGAGVNLEVDVLAKYVEKAVRTIE